MPRLDSVERAVLETFVRLDSDDPGCAWNSFYHEVVKAAGSSAATADAACRKLRRRKLLEGEGRGRMAAYWPTETGKAAVA